MLHLRRRAFPLLIILATGVLHAADSKKEDSDLPMVVNSPTLPRLGFAGPRLRVPMGPDFCREPRLPYDCQAEAAKLTPEQRRPASMVR